MERVIADQFIRPPLFHFKRTANLCKPSATLPGLTNKYSLTNQEEHMNEFYAEKTMQSHIASVHVR